MSNDIEKVEGQDIVPESEAGIQAEETQDETLSQGISLEEHEPKTTDQPVSEVVETVPPEDGAGDAPEVPLDLMENVTEEPRNAEKADSESGETVPSGDGAGDTQGVPFNLPENVTVAPQNPEQLDLKVLRGPQEGLEVYLRVSDDQGEYLGDTALEAKVKAFNEQYRDVEGLSDEDVVQVLTEGPKLTTKYIQGINRTDSWSKGNKAKYLIRAGMMLLLQKAAVKKKKGVWIEWFKANYIPEQLRSAQTYMSVAKVRNSIRYAILGIDRLYEIQRIVKDYRDEDPVRRFIQESGIVFDPSEEVDLVAFKQEIDIALAQQKLLENGLEGIAKERVEALVRDGIELVGKHIKALKLVKKSNGDLNRCMEEIFENGGKVEPTQDPATKADNFIKNTNRFMLALDTALDEDEYLSEIPAQVVRTLKLKIENLEAKILGSR